MDVGQSSTQPLGGRGVAAIAWSVCGLNLIFILCALLLDVLNGTLEAHSSFAIVVVANAVVGGLVASRRPANPVGWLFLGNAICISLNHLGGEYAVYLQSDESPFARATVWITIWSERLGAALLFNLLPLYFPNGHLVSPRWRPVARLAVLFAAVVPIASAFMPGEVLVYGRQMINPLGVEALRPIRDLFDAVGLVLFLGLILIAVASLVVRFRRSEGEERQQLKWFMYAVSTVLVWFALNWPIEDAVPELFPVMDALIIAGVPVAAGIAILKHHLFDIDFVINRTLVYGTLSACVVGIYILVVGYLGTLFRVDGNLLVSLVATGLVAVLFQPLRERLQRAINRLTYGERDDPYAVLSRLGERLEGTLAPEAVLPAIVETLREALKLPYTAIALPRDGGFEVVAASGEEPLADPLVLPLSYGGETVGRLLLAPRAPGEGFSSADRRLLDGVARQAGVAVQGVRTMADLRRSREKLVLAREEERRRLRRDLHDELAPTLAALGLSAATVGELIRIDPKEAASANEKLRAAIRATVGDVRRLVYDLRPPALDELGLIEAIRERASRYGTGDEGFRARVEAPDELPRLPAAVEVAAYRIVQEALMNVSRHAQASACFVRISCPGSPCRALEVEVVDDGVGLPDTPEGGVGLSSMRERVAELGGECEIMPASPSGTRVFARLPLGEPPLEGRKK